MTITDDSVMGKKGEGDKLPKHRHTQLEPPAPLDPNEPKFEPFNDMYEHAIRDLSAY